MKATTQQSGFSLVETLVAITILLLVIVGPMAITSQAARSSSFATEQVTAYFLAQEGVEIIQKARDDLYVRSFTPPFDPAHVAQPWTLFSNQNGPYALCYSANGCGLEMNTHTSGSLNDIRTPINCGSASSNSCLLYRTSASVRSRYTYTETGNIPTSFTRRIFLTRVSPNEVRVRSVVTWRSGSLLAGQQVATETTLFNLYGQ